MIKQKELPEIVNRISNIGFKPSSWFPTEEELTDLIGKPTEKNIEKNIDFLMWLLTIDRQLDEDELKMKEKIQKMVQKVVTK